MTVFPLEPVLLNRNVPHASEGIAGGSEMRRVCGSCTSRAEELTEDGVIVRTEHHLVIVDQAHKSHGNFFQLFLNGTQSPRHRRQELLMTRGKVCLQEGQDPGLCGRREE